MKAILLLSMLVAAPEAVQVRVEPKPDIVVTANRVTDTRKTLDACLARTCGPVEDIQASLAHAENLFVAGDYRQARRVLRGSISRNDRHAPGYPLEVSDLYRAYSRVAIHLGEGKSYKWATWGIRNALGAGLATDDIRLFGAELDIAGMQASLKDVKAARSTYRRLIRRSLARGRPDLAATVRIREAWLSQMERKPAITRRKLHDITNDPDERVAVQRMAARILLARLDRLEGKPESSDSLIEELRDFPFEKRALLYAPTIEPERDKAGFDKVWADIGFWIRPDGRIADVEILRQSGGSDWLKPVLKSIRGRIYSPLQGENQEGSFRVERYTYTSLWVFESGSRIRSRTGEPRIEFHDLTGRDAPPK